MLFTSLSQTTIKILNSLNLFFKVGTQTTTVEIQCLCNHLTSFAAQVFVVPNAIDFEKALEGFAELFTSSSNPVVLSAVIVIFVIYVLLLVWARRRDVRNAKKVCYSFMLIKSAYSHIGHLMVGLSGLCYQICLTSMRDYAS